MGSKLYVGGLPYSVTEQQLNDTFGAHGTVASARIITDKFTGQSRGFGFVEMSDDTAAKKAISELDQATVEGRAIKVVEAKPKEDKPARPNSPFKSDNGNGYKTNRW